VVVKKISKLLVMMAVRSSNITAKTVIFIAEKAQNGV